MPFYRIRANRTYQRSKHKQYARIFTHNKGWITERDFIDEWRTKEPQKDKFYQTIRAITSGLKTQQVEDFIGKDWDTLSEKLRLEGFSYRECQKLGTYSDKFTVSVVWEHEEEDVYDLSVDGHENFCTDSGVFHNCQIGENGHMFEISCKNPDIKEELEFLFYHPSMLSIDENLWSWCRDLFLFGDHFIELVIDPEEPKIGVLKVQVLPPDSMYRIDTIKGKTIEFQQAKDGPDYQSLAKVEVTKATEAELSQSTALRFDPMSIIHFAIGGNRKTFFPYGVSLIEAARGPAHTMKLMEDAQLVYRLCLTGDARVRTDNGWKYIKDIQLGDNVYTYDKDEKVVQSKVVDWFSSGIKKIFHIKSQHIDLKATENHPILVKRDEVIQYVYAKDLKRKKDQFINVTHDSNIPVEIPRIFGEKRFKLSDSGYKKFNQNKGKKLKIKGIYSDRVKQLTRVGITLDLDDGVKLIENFNLEKQDYLYCSKGEIRPEKINVPAIVDEDFARLFGFMLGDGFIINTQIGFAAGDDDEINQKYKTLLEKYFGESTFEPETRSDISCVGKYRVCSRTACNIYLAMGYIPNKYKKRIPAWAFNSSKEIRKALVEGLSDADGNERYTKAGLWFSSIELCNQKLVEDVKEIWHGIGFCSGKITYRQREGGHFITKTRKMPKTQSWKVTITNRVLPKYENVWFVKEIGEDKVYDITVDHDEHNFIANGCPVANSRAPERRLFYIDVGQLPPFKAEAFMDRLKDQFRKKKVFSAKGGTSGSGPVDERWTPQSVDEDFWIPLRPNSNTRVETLPGASNLGDVDDIKMFRDKLFISMCFPRNYMAQDDPGVTKFTLSSVDVKFARLVERLQRTISGGLTQVAIRHLQLRGFPSELFDDLQIKMTPPSHYREISENEVKDARVNRLSTLKGTMVYSDLDLLTEVMHVPLEKAKEIVARSMVQKLQELKLQVMSQNPQLLGIAMPQQPDNEMGTEPGGAIPSDMNNPQAGQDSGSEQDAGGQQQSGTSALDTYGQPQQPETQALEEPTEDDLKKYDLEIEDSSQGIDFEEIDNIEVEGG